MAQDVPDATDWLNTPLHALTALESALHCQVCKDFYDTPMVTSCSHTFCSKCIRTCLSTNGLCPACRASDQASKLRNNWGLQDAVAAFLEARPSALSFARRAKEEAAKTTHLGKRKRAVRDTEDRDRSESQAAHRYTTRSRTCNVKAAPQASQEEIVEVGDSDEDYHVSEPKDDATSKLEQDDGLVECPLGCGKRMKIEAVDPHLDRCEDERQQRQINPANHAPLNGGLNWNNEKISPRRRSNPAANRERLPELSYSLLNDTKLSRKLKELGIPNWGNRALLIKRHTEWVNMWNADCDSSNPRSKRELLNQLDAWERAQGGRAPQNATNAGSQVMRKDFDGAAWASGNKEDFSRLIADAKRTKTSASTGAPQNMKSGNEELSNGLANSPVAAQADGDSNLSGRTPSADHEAALSSTGSTIPATKSVPTSGAVPSSGFESVHDTMIQSDSPEKRRHSHDSSKHGGPSNDSPYELPAHLNGTISSSHVRRVPMFTVPQQVISDFDHEHDHGGSDVKL